MPRLAHLNHITKKNKLITKLERRITYYEYLLTDLGYVECEGCGNWILKAHLEKYKGLCYICSDFRSEEDKEMDAKAEAAVNTQAPKQEITIDQESWLETRVKQAIVIAQVLKSKCTTGQDQAIYEKALEGVVNGTIEEILNIFNLKLKD